MYTCIKQLSLVGHTHKWKKLLGINGLYYLVLIRLLDKRNGLWETNLSWENLGFGSWVCLKYVTRLKSHNMHVLNRENVEGNSKPLLNWGLYEFLATIFYFVLNILCKYFAKSCCNIKDIGNMVENWHKVELVELPRVKPCFHEPKTMSNQNQNYTIFYICLSGATLTFKCQCIPKWFAFSLIFQSILSHVKSRHLYVTNDTFLVHFCLPNVQFVSQAHLFKKLSLKMEKNLQSPWNVQFC